MPKQSPQERFFSRPRVPAIVTPRQARHERVVAPICSIANGNMAVVMVKFFTVSPTASPKQRCSASKASCLMKYCGRSSPMYVRLRSARTVTLRPPQRISRVLRCAFDKPVLCVVEGLRTNGQYAKLHEATVHYVSLPFLSFPLSFFASFPFRLFPPLLRPRPTPGLRLQ